MKKNNLGIVISSAMGISVQKQIQLAADVGFDAFFTVWNDGALVSEYKQLADEYGLVYHSVHGPSSGTVDMMSMWKSGEDGRNSAREMIRCIEDCSANEVGIMVSHVCYGFDYELPDDHAKACALENFGKVADRAAELGVKLALENIEGFEFLEFLLDSFRGHPAVGFCWDTGHEHCYYSGRDLTVGLGKQLIATHLHDNFGASDPNGRMNGRDDIHMLPFDGTIDWQSVADRLDTYGFDGVMMLEVKKTVWYSDRTENEKYKRMTPEEYVAAAYNSACRLLGMRKK